MAGGVEPSPAPSRPVSSCPRATPPGPPRTPIIADPARQTTLERFYQARYGLFVHYGLYSLLGRHEWVQLRERIPVAEYARLADDFAADRFDADAIAKLAIDAGMRYINLVTRHHESFCLWDTKTTDFNSTAAPRCGRDLVAEVADACRDHGLDLCLYISHGRDWRHPHAPNNDRFGGDARPDYPTPDPAYATGKDHDLQRYLDDVGEQVRELLTGYGPIASIWLDGIMTPLSPKDDRGRVIDGYDPRTDGDPFHCQDLYDLIHETQPGCLVSYKQGYLGTEDYFAPEQKAYNRFGQPFGPDRPGEVCTTMNPGSWGFHHEFQHQTIGPDEVWARLEHAAEHDCNLLLNVGPRPDGSIADAETDTLRAVGQRIERRGLPPLATRLDPA